MSVEIAGIKFKNPVTVASGTFGSGMEYCDFIDLSRLGAVTTKGVAAVPWEGNPVPRIAETPSGMLNAIGLQNPGIDLFMERDLSFLAGFDTNVIVNVCGHTEEEYLAVVERLYGDTRVSMLEINISCPNVREGGMSFGTDPEMVFRITRKIKAASSQPVIMKLTPNVTDIKATAKAAEDGGADAISLINTLTGMKIDPEKKAFVLANKTGGLSGPAIRPVAVRMVYEAAGTVKIPVIGMGGISTASDALEFILAGASMVSVGSANFGDPEAVIKVIDGIEDYMIRHNVSRITDLTGYLLQ